MGIRQFIAKALGYPFGPATKVGGLSLHEMTAPPGWGYQNYLKAYGEIGWLFACANVIAQAVAKQQWHLYELKADGDREEINEHELIDFLNHINPIQSRYQYFYLATLYKKLVGEEFWVLNFNGKGTPAEMWLAPPAFMNVIPSAKNYIDHYEFRRDNAKIDFTVQEVIHIMTPNPANPYRGLSEAQALTTDLDSERYAARYLQKFFFNDATPGFFIKYPAQDLPPADTRKELLEEWNERHQGFRNRGRVAFLWGGEPATVAHSNADSQLKDLRVYHRDVILAAYKVPPSILGITEHVNRANSEAAQYDFGQYCISPELVQLREAMNKELCPMFGDNLYLDFESPIPEDENSEVLNASNLFKAGIITRNEARAYVDMEPAEGPEGDEYFVQPTPFAGNPELPPPGPKMVKSNPKGLSADKAESYWKDYVSRVESYERRVIYELQMIALEQKQLCLDDLHSEKTPSIDKPAFKKAYRETMTPILTQVMTGAMQSGSELLEPVNPHKEGPISLTRAALRWLANRIGWAADEIGTESADRLAALLSDAYARGLGTDEIADLIEREFGYFSDVRAQRIARTETMTASVQGTIEGYKEAGLDKAEFYTAQDERTCEDCNGMNGEIFEVGDMEGVLPLHPQCRCVWLPVIE